MNNVLFTFDVDEALRTIQETKTIAISRFSKISNPPSGVSSEISEISKISNIPSVNLGVPINNISTQSPANSAKAANLDKLIKCHDCEYFLPDKIGDGSGIGTCRHDIRFTEEGRGRLPLYRNAERRCASFSNVSK